MSLDDAKFVLRLFNEPSFVRYIGDKGIRTIEDACSYIVTGPVESYGRHGYGLYVAELKDTRTAIGICGLLKREWLTDVDLGFAFLPEYWSRGYAFEAASAAVAYARGACGVVRIVAITSQDNAAAHRLLDRLGFRLERLVRPPDEEQEISLFAL
jgi:RimJ/RimL family protein N-acetyltransferase